MIEGISISPIHEMEELFQRKLQLLDSIGGFSSEYPAYLSMYMERESEDCFTGSIAIELVNKMTENPVSINLEFFKAVEYTAELDQLAWNTYQEYCAEDSSFYKTVCSELFKREIHHLLIKEPVYQSKTYNHVVLEKRMLDEE